MTLLNNTVNKEHPTKHQHHLQIYHLLSFLHCHFIFLFHQAQQCGDYVVTPRTRNFIIPSFESTSFQLLT
ncbi:hypothetical protein Hanom_Chr06g00541261 [Helianthus anomalus]